MHRDGELLWQLRSAAKRILPSTWDIACAGHVGAGDAPLAAAHRELREELGVALELRALERRLVRAPNETYVAHGFAGAPGADLALRPSPVEVAALAWWSEDEYRRRRDGGTALSPAGCELAEAFGSGRWPGVA